MTRLEINDYLNKNFSKDPKFFFLHCDSWHFDTKFKCINCGVQEPNMLNIAAGLMFQDCRVVVYGIAGFVLEKCMEQFRLVLPETGKLTILNAGNHHEYPKSLGTGHFFDVSKIKDFLESEGQFKILDLLEKDYGLDEIFKDKTNKKLVLLGFEN